MWWNVINDKSRPFCLISVTTSDNKYQLSDGITGNVFCHFAVLIVVHVTLDALGRGWHSQWLPVEIISPLWALCARPFFKRGSDDSLFFFFFWWRTAQTSFESGLHFSGRSEKLWSSCCVKGADTESWRQVRSTSSSVTWTCSDQVSPRKSFCYDERLRMWILFTQEWRLILGIILLQIWLWSSAIKAEISQEKYRVLRDQHWLDLNRLWWWILMFLIFCVTELMWGSCVGHGSTHTRVYRHARNDNTNMLFNRYNVLNLMC